MSELYVCKQYDTPYERVCAIISPLAEHDRKTRADVIDEFVSKVKEHYPNDTIALYKLMRIAEQLKEQK